MRLRDIEEYSPKEVLQMSLAVMGYAPCPLCKKSVVHHPKWATDDLVPREMCECMWHRL